MSDVQPDANIMAPGIYQAGTDNAGREFVILTIATEAGRTAQIYVGYSGHKHFSDSGRLHELLSAVQYCPQLKQDIASGQQINKTYSYNHVKFIVKRDTAYASAGCNYILYHSEGGAGRNVYQDQGYRRAAEVLNNDPRFNRGGGGGGAGRGRPGA